MQLVTLTANGQLILSVDDDLAKVKCFIPSIRVFRLPAAAAADCSYFLNQVLCSSSSTVETFSF